LDDAVGVRGKRGEQSDMREERDEMKAGGETRERREGNQEGEERGQRSKEQGEERGERRWEIREERLPGPTLGSSITSLRVLRNLAATSPLMWRWSAVRFTVMSVLTPIMPLMGTTVGLDAPIARMAPWQHGHCVDVCLIRLV